jgi:diguanylate cyclase (GGDEF)-like protein
LAGGEVFLKKRGPVPIDEGMSVQGPDPSIDGEEAARGLAGIRTAVAEAAPADDRRHDLRRLGEALKGGTDDVVAGMLRRSACSGSALDGMVEDSFTRVGSVSTIAVARWMAGDGEEVAREVGRESWRIFGQLAAQRAAPLNEVTKRCLRWRDAAEDVVRERAAALGLAEEVLSQALAMLQRSLDVTLVRMCEAFEDERRKAHEELSRRQDELAFLATHDPLTGLPNRTLILDRVEQMLVRSRRSRTPVAALFVDLDNFKSINDTLGHGAGDRLLKAVAARLGAAIRETDALGRLGGDEFVVIAEGMSLAAGPELIAERLLAALEQPFRLDGPDTTRLAVSASVGIAMGDRESADELLRDADIAMYRAKWEGKNRYVVFESAMQDAVQSRMELEMDLREAVETDQFFLVYQPTFDLQSMSPTGVEALLRWNSPKRGVVQPDDFVQLLEETGMIVEVGRWVLREACHQSAAWRAAGHAIGMSVNVSARQLETDEFVDHVREALAESGLEPGTLTLEITETTIMRDAQRTVRRLAAIKALGVRIAIDDFGTGYSSLSHLQQFPVDALKIDRSFIARLTQSPEGETLIRTLVQLGKAMSIETLAEGIEHHGELSLLQDELCDSGQGFLFARPLDASTAEAFFRTWSGDLPEAFAQEAV